MWLVRCLAGFRQALRDRTIGLKSLFSFAVAQLIYVIIYQPKTSWIMDHGYKTMDDKLMYIINDDKQNYPFCGL